LARKWYIERGTFQFIEEVFSTDCGIATDHLEEGYGTIDGDELDTYPTGGSGGEVESSDGSKQPSAPTTVPEEPKAAKPEAQKPGTKKRGKKRGAKVYRVKERATVCLRLRSLTLRRLRLRGLVTIAPVHPRLRSQAARRVKPKGLR